MPLSRSFKTTVKARAENDAAYRGAILQQAVESLLKGDVDAAKSAIRVYINATVGFDALAKRTGTPSKSLMRMFGPRGNPSARNLSTVLQQLQRNSGVRLSVRSSWANAPGMN
jgi:DNA-binding phage protein